MLSESSWTPLKASRVDTSTVSSLVETVDEALSQRSGERRRIRLIRLLSASRIQVHLSENGAKVLLSDWQWVIRLEIKNATLAKLRIADRVIKFHLHEVHRVA